MNSIDFKVSNWYIDRKKDPGSILLRTSSIHRVSIDSSNNLNSNNPDEDTLSQIEESIEEFISEEIKDNSLSKELIDRLKASEEKRSELDRKSEVTTEAEIDSKNESAEENESRDIIQEESSEEYRENSYTAEEVDNSEEIDSFSSEELNRDELDSEDTYKEEEIEEETEEDPEYSEDIDKDEEELDEDQSEENSEEHSIFNEIHEMIDFHELVDRSRDLKKVVFFVNHFLAEELDLDSETLKKRVADILEKEFELDPEKYTINVKESKRISNNNIFLEIVFSDNFAILQNEKIRQMINLEETNYQQFDSSEAIYKKIAKQLGEDLSRKIVTEDRLEQIKEKYLSAGEDISGDLSKLFYGDRIAIVNSFNNDLENEGEELKRITTELQINEKSFFEEIIKTLDMLLEKKESIVGELTIQHEEILASKEKKVERTFSELINIEEDKLINDSFIGVSRYMQQLKEYIDQERSYLEQFLKEDSNLTSEDLLNIFEELDEKENILLYEIRSELEKNEDSEEIEKQVDHLLQIKKLKRNEAFQEIKDSDYIEQLQKLIDLEKVFLDDVDQYLQINSRKFLKKIDALLKENIAIVEKHKDEMFVLNREKLEEDPELKELVEIRRLKEKELSLGRRPLLLISELEKSITDQYREFQRGYLDELDFNFSLLAEDENGNKIDTIGLFSLRDIYSIFNVRQHIFTILKSVKQIISNDIRIWKNAYLSYVNKKQQLRNELAEFKGDEDSFRKKLENFYSKRMIKNIYTFKMNLETVSRSLLKNADNLKLSETDSQLIKSITENIRQSIELLKQLDEESRKAGMFVENNTELDSSIDISENSSVESILESLNSRYNSLLNQLKQLEEDKTVVDEKARQLQETMNLELISSDSSREQLDLENTQKQIEQLEKEYRQLLNSEDVSRKDLFLIENILGRKSSSRLKLLDRFFDSKKIDLTQYDALFSIFSALTRVNRIDKNGRTFLTSEIDSRLKNFIKKTVNRNRELIELEVVKKLEVGSRYKDVISKILNTVNTDNTHQGLIEFDVALSSLKKINSLDMINDYVLDSEGRTKVLELISTTIQQLEAIDLNTAQELKPLYSQLEQLETEIRSKIDKNRKILMHTIDKLSSSFIKVIPADTAVKKAVKNLTGTLLKNAVEENRRIELTRIEENIRSNINKIKDILGDSIEEIDILGNITEPILHTLESMGYEMIAGPDGRGLDTIYLTHYSKRSCRMLEERFRQMKNRIKLVKENIRKKQHELKDKIEAGEIVDRVEKKIDRIVQVENEKTERIVQTEKEDTEKEEETKFSGPGF